MTKSADVSLQTTHVELLALKAPIDGVVEKVIQTEGEVADIQKPSIVVVKNDPLYIDIKTLKTSIVQKLKKGDTLAVRYPGVPRAATTMAMRMVREIGFGPRRTAETATTPRHSGAATPTASRTSCRSKTRRTRFVRTHGNPIALCSTHLHRTVPERTGSRHGPKGSFAGPTQFRPVKWPQPPPAATRASDTVARGELASREVTDHDDRVRSPGRPARSEHRAIPVVPERTHLGSG